MCLKKAMPKVHCVIQRQHLVAKKLSARLHDALNMVLKVVNHIKSRSFRDRFFRKFWNKSGEKLMRLVLHTEVRGLSKGNYL